MIYTNTEIPKPEGIYWDLLSPQKLAQVKVLRDLKARVETERGPDNPLPTGPDEELPPLAVRAEKERLKKEGGRRRGGRGGERGGGRGGGGGGGGGGRESATTSAAESRRIFLTGVGQEDSWRDVKRRVEEAVGGGADESSSFDVKILPRKSKGGSRAALVTFTEAAAAATALERLASGEVGGGKLKGEWARSQPGGGNRGGGETRE